jgi:hypothetical protein
MAAYGYCHLAIVRPERANSGRLKIKCDPSLFLAAN